ncbi:LPXTG cell wall anchor domain-containing protein [Listeria newyorkensis]|uniref:LPXTG cell wall anchor domain-containing protein n=1 Tax=Listeria newyorkensis TaxID=1497681 RepID=A0A841YX54_9LIST|nr:LPXTG cell wall anchor domain-containing protein [Listeria newyorkensis]MBC1457649.1 LPXTG cell wall anchor domain-containing protein [Listeria newyorkensis]
MNKKVVSGFMAISTVAVLAQIPNTMEVVAADKADMASSTTSKMKTEAITPFTIMQFDVNNEDGFNEGLVGNFRVFDLTSKLQADYMNKSEFGDKLTYEIRDFANASTVLKAEAEIDYAGTIDISSLSDGKYYIVLKSYNVFGYDTGTMIVNVQHVAATVDVTGEHGKINPNKLTVGSDKANAETVWTIKDANGTDIETGTGSIPDTLLSSLKEGSYTIENTATIVTEYGNTVADTATDTFLIRHPESTTTVDKPINPSAITGGQKISESTLSWEIKGSDGTTIAMGTGKDVPKETITGLTEGSYTVSFTELSPEGETHESTGNFLIRHPESTTTVDKSINPSAITGGQKIPESTLSWEIKNSDGTVIATGTGKDVPKATIADLKEGSYTANFTELSPEGETHKSTGNFLIRHPESTTIVDKSINPSAITGGQKIPESTLSWEIKNSDGIVIATGSGKDVPKAMITGLEEGSYTVSFTELSPEGETHKSTGDFLIRHPESTTTVDKAINPGTITGSQKIPESTLSWEIKNSDGIVMATGAGKDVPRATITGLGEGSYTVFFTELSPEGETHKSTGGFLIRHPESTTTIDKPVNPESITGSKKIPDSTLTWEIKDKDGIVVVKGDGTKVPKLIIDSLKSGDYTVAFNELSPEGETSISSGKFTMTSIVDPAPVNPNTPEKSDPTNPAPAPSVTDQTGPEKTNVKQSVAVNQSTPKPITSAEKATTLPSTGDNNSLLLMLSGMLLVFVSFFGFKTKSTRRK